MGKKCENTHKVTTVGKRTSVGPCSSKATTSRKDFRFGDMRKGEPIIVDIVHHLCEECADSWDALEAEGRAEANAS